MHFLLFVSFSIFLFSIVLASVYNYKNDQNPRDTLSLESETVPPSNKNDVSDKNQIFTDYALLSPRPLIYTASYPLCINSKPFDSKEFIVHGSFINNSKKIFMILQKSPIPNGVLYSLDVTNSHQESDFDYDNRLQELLSASEASGGILVTTSVTEGVLVINKKTRKTWLMTPNEQRLKVVCTIPGTENIIRGCFNPNENIYVVMQEGFYTYQVMHIEVKKDYEPTIIESRIIVRGLSDPLYFDSKYGIWVAWKISKDLLIAGYDQEIKECKLSSSYFSTVLHFGLIQSFSNMKTKQDQVGSQSIWKGVFLKIVSASRVTSETPSETYYDFSHGGKRATRLNELVNISGLPIIEKDAKTLNILPLKLRTHLPRRREHFGDGKFWVPQTKYPTALVFRQGSGFLSECRTLNDQNRRREIIELLSINFPNVLCTIIFEYAMRPFLAEQVIFPIDHYVNLPPPRNYFVCRVTSRGIWRLEQHHFHDRFKYVSITNMLSSKILMGTTSISEDDHIELLEDGLYAHYDNERSELCIKHAADDKKTLALISNLRLDNPRAINYNYPSIFYDQEGKTMAVHKASGEIAFFDLHIDQDYKDIKITPKTRKSYDRLSLLQTGPFLTSLVSSGCFIFTKMSVPECVVESQTKENLIHADIQQIAYDKLGNKAYIINCEQITPIELSKNSKKVESWPNSKKIIALHFSEQSHLVFGVTRGGILSYADRIDNDKQLLDLTSEKIWTKLADLNLGDNIDLEQKQQQIVQKVHMNTFTGNDGKTVMMHVVCTLPESVFDNVSGRRFREFLFRVQ